MSKQRTLHGQAIEHLDQVKRIIDELKDAGADQADGFNALLNIIDRAEALAARARRGVPS